MSRPEEHVLALILAGTVNLLRRENSSVDDQRDVLRTLVKHTSDRSVTVRLRDDTLMVDSAAIPSDVPLVPEFASSMKSHGIAEIRIAHPASPLDLIEMLRLIAAEPGAMPISERLQQPDASTVLVVGAGAADTLNARRAARVTDAVGMPALPAEPDATPAAPADKPEPEPEPTPEPKAEPAQAGVDDVVMPIETVDNTPVAIEPPPERLPELIDEPPLFRQPRRGRETITGFVPASEGAAFNMMLELTSEPQTRLAKAVDALEGERDPDLLSKELTAVTVGAGNAVKEKRAHEAIEAIIKMIRFEQKETREDLRARYGVAFKRLLTESFLRPLIPFLLDELYYRDVAQIMTRAGPDGTRVLLNYLVDADTYAERRAFLDALQHIEMGKDIVVSMLNHHHWYVVRNVADLVGDLKIEDGVAALAQAAEHEDARVRRSAGVALAKIGTPETGRHLLKILQDADRTVRLDTIKAIDSRSLAALEIPLLKLIKKNDDMEMREASYRALGAIGTPGAVQALIAGSKPGGILHRQPLKLRLAAIAGLGAAGGESARDALRALAKDRDQQIRRAAMSSMMKPPRGSVQMAAPKTPGSTVTAPRLPTTR